MKLEESSTKTYSFDHWLLMIQLKTSNIMKIKFIFQVCMCV